MPVALAHLGARGIGCFVAFCSGVQLLRCIGRQQVHTGGVTPQNAQTIVEGQDLVTPGSPRPCGFGVVGQVQAGDHRPIPARVGGDLVTVELGKNIAGWGNAPHRANLPPPSPAGPQQPPVRAVRATLGHPHHGAVIVQQQQACGLARPVGMGRQRIGGKGKALPKACRQAHIGMAVYCAPVARRVQRPLHGVVQGWHGVGRSAKQRKVLHPPLPAPWPAQVERRQRRVGRGLLCVGLAPAGLPLA